MKKLSIPHWTSSVTFLLAVLISIASLFGLFSGTPYAAETENWRLQAQGQDIGNLLGVVVLVVSGVLAARGSVRARLVWVGMLFYFIYAYMVYAFAVHLNDLFLIYVSVLGLALYAVLAYFASTKPTIHITQGRTLAVYTLIVTGVVFALLWLGELVPALLTNTVPDSLQDAGLWVNPIHVIDLSTVLPGFIITGTLLLWQNRWGHIFAIPWLAFSALMGSSIVAAMLLMQANGYTDTLPPTIMLSLLVTLCIIALVRVLRGKLTTTPGNVRDNE